MNKIQSLSFLMLFSYLEMVSVHALSRQVSLEVASTADSRDMLQHGELLLPMEGEGEIKDSCLKAVKKGDLEELKLLLWDRDKSNKIASFCCAQDCHERPISLGIVNLIRDFICVFKDINEIKTKYGVNLLHAACMSLSKQSIPIVELILSLGINVNAQTTYGQTALHSLCQQLCDNDLEKDREAIFDLIMKKGGNCAIKNSQQEYPLHLLCKTRYSTFSLPLGLLKRCAKTQDAMNAMDSFKMTPLHILCDEAFPRSLPQQPQTCIRQICIDVQRVAYYHARSKHAEGMKYLLAHGAEPSLQIKNYEGHTPFDLASKDAFSKSCFCCGIVCCYGNISFPCFPTSKSTKDTAQDLLLTVNPLAGSVCPKLSYCCWATRADIKLIVTMWVSVAVTIAITLLTMLDL